jgi:methyl-accepting chemotaxis protein
VPALATNAPPDLEWVKGLLDRFTMSEMRARFVAQLLDGTNTDDLPGHGSDAGGPSESGSVELF